MSSLVMPLVSEHLAKWILLLEHYIISEKDFTFDDAGKCKLLFVQLIILLKDFAQKAAISLDMQRTYSTLFMSNIKKTGRICLAYFVLVKAIYT